MAAVKKIYILHGWTYSLDKWEKLEDLLIKAGIESVMIKIPGLTAPIEKEWGIDDYISWLKDILKTEDKVVFLGHSNGGRIAANFAILYPQKIKHLILIDSAGIHHKNFYARLKRQAFQLVAKAGKKITKSLLVKKLLYRLVREDDYYKAGEEMKKTMINLLESDKNLDFKKIAIPTTIIWGRKDKITPFADAEIIKQQIVGAELYPIDAKHAPFATDPEEVAKIIAKVLR